MSDETARANLLSILADSSISRIQFNVGSVTISPGLFTRVAQGVRDGHIRVRHVPGLVSSGIYNSTENRFYLRRESFPDIPARALVVHEACHAGLDVARAAQMRVISSEAAAFISQCVYARSKSSDPENDRLYDDDARKDKVFEVAWGIAGRILSGSSPTESDIQRLRQAVLQHPDYVSEGQGVTGYDGVPGM
jgi:hypothetical protein